MLRVLSLRSHWEKKTFFIFFFYLLNELYYIYTFFFFFAFLKNFIEAQLIYNVRLVSGVLQSE